MLQIICNGSKWAGEKPDTISDLLQTLKEYPLDRVFEQYGNFIHAGNITEFWGNFATLSHVFHIRSDDSELIDKLTQTIRENQKRPDYLSQPDPLEENKED